MRELFKKLFNRIFKVKLLAPAEEKQEESKNNTNSMFNKKEDFLYKLKRDANIEVDDGNGQGIKKLKRIEELV